jgi:hypothetical protein
MMVRLFIFDFLKTPPGDENLKFNSEGFVTKFLFTSKNSQKFNKIFNLIHLKSLN